MTLRPRLAIESDNTTDLEFLCGLIPGTPVPARVEADLRLTTSRGSARTLVEPGFVRLGFGPEVEVLARAQRLLLRGPGWAAAAETCGSGPPHVRFESPRGPRPQSRLLAKLCADQFAAAVERRRRGIALHAAAVEVPGGLVLLLGHSGFGKSSIASLMVPPGAPGRLVSDDLTILAEDAPAAVLVLRRTSGQGATMQPLGPEAALAHHLSVRHRRSTLVVPRSAGDNAWVRARLQRLVDAVPHRRLDVGLGGQAEAARLAAELTVGEVMQAS
jgi:hypothetical protein